MTDYHQVLRTHLAEKEHRPSGRAIVFDPNFRRILVEQNTGAGEEYVSFPGGGILWGETLEECISREFHEEFGAEILGFEFLFLVENFIPFEGEIFHGIELFCEVKLASDKVQSRSEGLSYPWVDVSSLGDIDLRPIIVRDRILDGTYRGVRHLISHI